MWKCSSTFEITLVNTSCTIIVLLMINSNPMSSISVIILAIVPYTNSGISNRNDIQRSITHIRKSANVTIALSVDPHTTWKKKDADILAWIAAHVHEWKSCLLDNGSGNIKGELFHGRSEWEFGDEN